MIITGTHRGQVVEIEYDPSIATFLRNRAEAITAKALSKGNIKMAQRFRESVTAWDQILSNPSLLNLVEEFGPERSEYLDRVFFNDAGFTAMFK